MARPLKKKTPEKKSTGIRYTQNKREMVLAWIKAYNKGHNGRGGEAQAAKHFGVSATAIRGWLGKLKPGHKEYGTTKWRLKRHAQKTITVMQKILKALG